MHETPALFITELFTIAELWNQPKYTTINEWMKKMWDVHTMEYYTSITKNGIMSLQKNG
jgi:hypothetical protein